MAESPAFWAVIPAAGIGTRMGAKLPKQYLPLAGQTVLEHTLAVFLRNPRIAGIIIALSPADATWSRLTAASSTSVHAVEGGVTRADSVFNALKKLANLALPQDFVLVHDAARPCLTDKDLNHLMDTLMTDEVGGLLGIPVRDTLKQTDDAGRALRTVDRSRLWHAHTPQMFRLGLLTDCLRDSLAQGWTITDEASAVEQQGLLPKLVEGSAENIKITYARDLILAEAFLRIRSAEGEPASWQ